MRLLTRYSRSILINISSLAILFSIPSAGVVAAPVNSWIAESIDGSQSPPPYGMRLDGFFDGVAGNQVTFSFDSVRFDEFADGGATLTGLVSVAEYKNLGGPGSFASTWSLLIPFQLIDDSIAQVTVPDYTVGYRYYLIASEFVIDMMNQADGTDFAEFWTFPDSSKPFQVGMGANGKNAEFGASGWLNYVHEAGGVVYGDSLQHIGSSDLLMNLVPVQTSTLACPADTAVTVCSGSEVCIPGFVCPDGNCTTSLGILVGDQVCFTPDSSGVYSIIFTSTDTQGVTDSCVTLVTVDVISTPLVTDQSFFSEECNLRTDRILQPLYGNQVGLSFSLLSGVGLIDAVSGAISYRPDTAGVFMFTVEVFNSCGADTVAILDSLILNQPPAVFATDTTVVLCDVQEICIDIFSSDPENDPVTISQLEGLGTFTQLTDSTGQTCFLPADIDSAVYAFVYRATDSCVLFNDGNALGAPVPCCLDTVFVTVLINQAPVLTCPGPQTFFACSSDSLCFDIMVEDDNPGSVTLNVLSGNASISGNTVCVSADVTTSFDVVIEAIDGCRSDTCTIPVSITRNAVPMVHTAADFSMSLCSPETICFAATADDRDFNLASTSMNFGSYDAGTNRICFTADSSGIYTLILSAVDSCDATGSDTTIVTVLLDAPPVVSLGQDFDALCATGEICIPVTLIDNNISLITTNIGVFDTASQALCFTPDTAGEYTVILQVSDDCGNLVADTVIAKVTVSNPPMISGFADSTVFLCTPEQICLPTLISDLGNDIQSITLNQGTYTDGTVCFVPFDSGRFEIILTVVDSCGNSAVDTAIVIVQTDQGVTLTAPADTSLFLCAPDTICIPVGGVPANATVTVGGTGVWWDEASQSVCFYSDCCLENIITVSATTPCATFTTEITVSVKTNSKPLVILPPDSSILVCDLSPICFPVGINDIDGNLDSITVSGGTFDAFQNTICFTPDSSGVYLLSVQAIDSCGEIDSDSVFVTVTLNQPPVVSYIPGDTIFTQCAPELICLPVGISDLEMNIDSIIVSGGSYDAVAGTVCILPDGQGDFFASVVAVDACGLRDSVEIAITVNGGDFVSINCPVDDFFVAQCGPGQVCLPLEITGSNFTVDVPGALWSNGQFCFAADSSGLYNFVVTAQTNCGIAVCSLSVLVQIDSPAALSCPADQSVFLCAPDTLAYELTISGTVDSIIAGNGVFVVGDSVYVPVLASGQTVVNVTAFGPCGDAQCSFIITADFNSAPFVQANDADFSLCTLGEVCIPFTASDIDGNLESISSSIGFVSGPVGSLGGSKSKAIPLNGAQVESTRGQYQVCFTPDMFGQFEIVLTALDSCGATSVDTLLVTITQGDTVALTADKPVLPFEFCAVADSICWPVTIDGVPDQVVTSLGILSSGQLCFLPDSAGIYSATIIGDAECNSDTLVLNFEVKLAEPVSVICSTGDTTVSFCALPDTVFLPISISGTIDSLHLSPSNLIIDTVAGLMKLPVDSSGSINVSVVAFGFCGADSCSFVLTVDGNVPPVVTLGADSAIFLCAPGEVCLPFSAFDGDLDLLTITTSIGQIRSDSVCFFADSSGSYEIILSATDPCGATSLDMILIDVILPEPLSIDLGLDVSRFVCGDPTICIPVALTGNSVSVITNFGSYSPADSQICFVADTAGIYTMIAEASDSCGNVATDTLLLDISFNNAPTIAGFSDSSVFICSPTPVCLPVSIDDLDGNIASITVSRGQYENGQVCFIPYNIGLQEIVLTVTDSCGLTTIDTVFVDVLTDQAVSITFPSDTSVFLCQADTLCFPVTGVPADATVEVGGTNVWWDAATQSVCFFSNCCLENMITVRVTTACGNQFRGIFTASVRTNSAPLAILPPDTAISQCAFEPVCFPVGISDADGNLMTVEVIGATFDAFQNTACLTPDTAGVYLISVIATDSCGAVDRDDLFVTIRNNQPPVITYTPIDTAIKQCLPAEVCIPVTVFDPDDNVVNISVIGGRYDSLLQSVCILPTGIGQYCAQVIATDACGLIDSVDICINITGGDGTSIVCPVTTLQPLPICDSGQICVPLEVLGVPDSVISTLGNWSNDTLCFTADSSGLYTALVISYAQCNNDTCMVTVQVNVAEPAQIVCPVDSVVAVCQTDTVCFDFSTFGTVDSVIVSAPAFISGGQVCVPVSQSGVQTITLTAIGPCGLDSCSFDVTTIGNTPPVVDIIAADFAIKQCQLSEICVPISINDVDGNIVDTLTSFGTIRNDSLCFTPSSFGSIALVLSAFDQCGELTADTVTIQVIAGAAASITCPSSPQMATFCQPDTVCIPVAISGADTVTVFSGGWYDIANGTVCIPVDSAGTYSILINASGFCGDDSCGFELQVSQGIAPNVSCPVTVDTTLCLSQPDSVCFPVTITGSGLTVTVEPAGRYENGIVCVPVSSEGQLEVTIIANGDCGADSCTVTLNVNDNQAPLLTLPVGPFSIDFCPRDTVPFCLAGIFATDVDGSVSITQVCGAGQFEAVRADSGQLCFLPTAAGQFEFCFVATDGCRSDSGSIFINVTERADCDVCVTLALESDSCAIVGKNTRVSITANSNEAIGGFELLFSFDASALAFSQATIEGTSIETWEYFTWNLGGAGCGAACPSGLVRVVGIADQNDGPSHPPDSALHPRGDLAFIDFRVANDQNLAGQFIPINWSWFDCNDNSISDPSGTILFVDNRIFGAEGNLLWDEADDVSFPESARPFGLGSPDDCFTGGGGVNPIRCLDYKQGGLCIGSGTAGNNRGDINLNGLAYEVGDAVLFTNFFISGLNVFTVDVAAQIAATDVNADGLTLTVADLVFLLRVITGDADAVPKVEPFAKPAKASLARQTGNITISGEAEAGIGGMLLILSIDPAMEIGEPLLGEDAAAMEFIYQIEGSEMRLLVYSMNSAQINPGKFDLISIPFTGEGEAGLISAEAADYTGRPYRTNISSSVLPEEFALDQNYPNPFNPTTTISFSLASRSEWHLSIYNVVGKLVREYVDESEAGVQNVVWDGRDNRGSSAASGVYFYRLTAGSFLQTRKMILLK